MGTQFLTSALTLEMDCVQKASSLAVEQISVAYKALSRHSFETLENPTVQNRTEIRVFISNRRRKRKLEKSKLEEISIWQARKQWEIGFTSGANMSKENFSNRSTAAQVRYWKQTQTEVVSGGRDWKDEGRLGFQNRRIAICRKCYNDLPVLFV